MWKKVLIYLKIQWKKILMILAGIVILILATKFIMYCATNYFGLESFTKKSIAGQMAMTLPMFLLVQLFILPFYFLLYWWLYQGGGAGSIKKHKIDKNTSGVKWSDVIGMDEAKKDAWEVVKLLKDRSLLKVTGGNIIKGMLMIGPPGCGKTYLAKAIATECELPMISAVGSEFVAMFMGQGAARMKTLFKQAREEANIHGGCIVFIDEIDAFARPRDDKMGGGFSGGGAQSSYNATINQFLTEMDGLRHKENNVVVIAATNVEEEELDSAIMRSGRFDRKIRVEKPNAKEREDIIKFYLSSVEHEQNINIEKLADKTKWFSPSDVNNMVRESGVLAMRENRTIISEKDLFLALDRVMISIEKTGGDKILSDKVNVKWADVIGMDNAKKEAWEIVDLLRDRNKLKAVGGKIVKGVMMLGPPGCGKTYLAKAMATEAGFPFISRAGSEFVGMFVGEGNRKMKLLFDEARKVARAEGGCIIFIDEIDSFARPRTADHGFGGQTSHNATINQFLTELDGLRQAENNIVVLAATNAREDELDSAIMRAGRFDRKIHVTRPNLKEREALFVFYLGNVNCDETCNPKVLAQKTLYYSPSEIDSMVREAGIFALRDKRDVITFKDLSNAYDRITYGDRSNINLTEKEKIWTAYHEAGHAIIAYLLHPSNDVIKATIIPRKGSLGMVSQRPIEETHSATKEDMIADIKVSLAAYVAERITFGSTSSGVGGGRGSDFDQAMRRAQAMVWSLGMGPSGLLGDFKSMQDNYGNFNIAEKTREILDQDVQHILRDCINDIERILNENKDVLKAFAEALLEKGELEYDEIKTIFDQFGLQAASRPEGNPNA